jgi:uncharacterized protein (TIGR00255 family)
VPIVRQSPALTYILGVLPARWGSSRFPGKPLHLIAGKPLIQHVWERCQQCTQLDEIIVATDDERIRQEVTLFVNKIDVDEELARLATHLDELTRIVKHGGAAGKRLDFLMQELNREANTLGSKSADMTVTQVAMDLKLLIEQMREQIQNIE